MNTEPDFTNKFNEAIKKSPSKVEALSISKISQQDLENNRKIWDAFINKKAAPAEDIKPLGYAVNKVDYLLENPTIDPSLLKDNGVFLIEGRKFEKTELENLIGKSYSKAKLDKIDKSIISVLSFFLFIFVGSFILSGFGINENSASELSASALKSVLDLAVLFFGFVLVAYMFFVGCISDNNDEQKKKTVSWLDRDSLGIPGED